jgi:protein-S-isoprenylcysteine O-methyltransferase Ste14
LGRTSLDTPPHHSCATSLLIAEANHASVGEPTMHMWRQILAIMMLPGTVTLIVPSVIITRSGGVQIGWLLPWPLRLLLISIGLLLIVLGLMLLYQTITLFATRGHGTLAPWDPPQHLVVRGIYRHVRNPMISGVFSILLGEGMLLGSRPLLYWLLIFVSINLIYIPLVEEPSLARRFGAEYRLYQQHVPRWIPRVHPWQSPGNDHAQRGD